MRRLYCTSIIDGKCVVSWPGPVTSLSLRQTYLALISVDGIIKPYILPKNIINYELGLGDLNTNLVNTDSGNALLPIQFQVITWVWSNADLLLVKTFKKKNKQSFN